MRRSNDYEQDQVYLHVRLGEHQRVHQLRLLDWVQQPSYDFLNIRIIVHDIRKFRSPKENRNGPMHRDENKNEIRPIISVWDRSTCVCSDWGGN